MRDDYAAEVSEEDEGDSETDYDEGDDEEYESDDERDEEGEWDDDGEGLFSNLIRLYQEADKRTLFAALIRFSLGFSFITFWVAKVIDIFVYSNESILGFSPFAFGVGLIVAVILALGDAYCHFQQDRLSQESANLTRQERDRDEVNQLGISSKILLSFAAASDVITIAGFFTDLILEFFRKVGQSLSETSTIALLIGTFVIGLIACVAEYHTNRKALEADNGARLRASVDNSSSFQVIIKNIWRRIPWPSITAIVYFLLTGIGTGLWVASLWDGIASLWDPTGLWDGIGQNGEDVLSASLPAMIVGFGVSTILTWCYIHCRWTQNRINGHQNGNTFSHALGADEFAAWRWRSENGWCLSRNGFFLLGAGAASAAGLAALMLEKVFFIFEETIGYIAPKGYRIIFTGVALIISIFASLAENRTLKRALLCAEAEKRKQRDARREEKRDEFSLGSAPLPSIQMIPVSPLASVINDRNTPRTTLLSPRPTPSRERCSWVGNLCSFWQSSSEREEELNQYNYNQQGRFGYADGNSD